MASFSTENERRCAGELGTASPMPPRRDDHGRVRFVYSDEKIIALLRQSCGSPTARHLRRRWRRC